MAVVNRTDGPRSPLHCAAAADLHFVSAAPGNSSVSCSIVVPAGVAASAVQAQGVLGLHTDRQSDLPARQPGAANTLAALHCCGVQVQFRVIVLSPQLKPSVTGAISVSMQVDIDTLMMFLTVALVQDGGGSLVRSWDRVFTSKVLPPVVHCLVVTVLHCRGSGRAVSILQTSPGSATGTSPST